MIWLSDALDEFLDYGGYKTNTRLRYSRLLVALSRYESDKEMPLYMFSVDLMHEAFIKVSRNFMTRQVLRTLVAAYLDWLQASGADVSIGRDSLQQITDTLLKQGLNQHYYYGIEDLLLKMELDMNCVAEERMRDPEDYRIESSSLVLTWYGYKLNEIVNFKKSDILPDNKILKSNEPIEIHPEAWKLLSDYADASFYTSLSKGGYGKHYYIPSEYLIRTEKSHHLRSTGISSQIAKFNSKLPPNAERYDLNYVRWSGKYYRAWEYLQAHPQVDLDKLEDDREFLFALFETRYRNTTEITVRLSEFKFYISQLD
jgi:hypothetical protein